MSQDPVTVVYMFYMGSSLDPTSSTSLVQSMRSMGTKAISKISRSPITHVLVALKLSNGYVYCNWNPRRGTHWSNRSPKLIPDRVVFEEGTLDLDLLDSSLPLGEKSRWWQVLVWYLTGFPRHTMSCVMVVHRLRRLMGRTTKARSPGGCYRELKESTVDQSRTTGPNDP